MAKISKYTDGGALQSADKVIVARNGKNYNILGSNLSSSGGSGTNILSNGGMRVAQRGAGPFTSTSRFPNNDDVYLIDGTILLSDGNDIVDESQVADSDFVSGYKVRLDVETANKRFGILMPVDNKGIQGIRYSGTASLQFKVKCTGTSISNVRAYLLAWNGTADAITSDVISAWGSAGADPTFAANWTAENTASNLAITTTIATKTIENIAVDTSGVTNLAVLIIVDDTDATVGDYLEIGDVKLENSISCTTYQNDDNDGLACLRRLLYIPLVNPNPVGSGWASGIGTSAQIALYTPTLMRGTLALSAGAASTFTVRANGADNAASAISLASYYGNIASINFTATVAVSHVSTVYANASTYILLSSEL